MSKACCYHAHPTIEVVVVHGGSVIEEQGDLKFAAIASAKPVMHGLVALRKQQEINLLHRRWRGYVDRSHYVLIFWEECWADESLAQPTC